jgi:transposase
VLGLVATLRPIVIKINELTRQIRSALEEHPDGQTFRSLFIDPNSVVCAATMLAEIGDCRERYPTYRTLAADGGQAPVAVESGKSRRASHQHAIRILGRAWCSVIWRLWQDQTTYDPIRHTAHQRLITPEG